MLEFTLDLDYQKPGRWSDYHMWILVMLPSAKHDLPSFGNLTGSAFVIHASYEWKLEKTVSEVAYFFFSLEKHLLLSIAGYSVNIY